MIFYIIPKYFEGVGDRTIINFNGNTEEVKSKNIRSILRDISKEKGQDLKELKYKCSRITNLGKLTPIAISTNEILIPIKVRKPRVHRDAGYGYINIFYIEQITENYILMNNGSKIFYEENRRSIIKRLKLAKNLGKAIIQFEYKNINFILNEVLKLDEKLATIVYK